MKEKLEIHSNKIMNKDEILEMAHKKNRYENPSK